MNVLMVTTEAVPFTKAGGLADVCAALPIELASLGHNVTLFLPAFRQVFENAESIQYTDVDLEIPIGTQTVRGSILATYLPGTKVRVYFIQQDEYFDRAGLYGERGEDYRDNCQRFVFFCRGVMEAIRLLELDVDIIHCHDWQTGLIPAYLQTEYRSVQGYETIATLFTIHNLAYQARFWHWDMLLTGLDWKYFNWQQLEYFGDLSLLKAGIVFADAISTVSARYADEIQRPELGCGLESVLHHRRDVLTGILNGVDYKVWNPETDKYLPGNYTVADWQSGKAACKNAAAKTARLERVSTHAADRIHRPSGGTERRRVHDRSAQEVGPSALGAVGYSRCRRCTPRRTAGQVSTGVRAARRGRYHFFRQTGASDRSGSGYLPDAQPL